MTQLNDLQRVLLAAAAARTDFSLLPFPASIFDEARRDRAIHALIRKDLVVEVEVAGRKPAWRVHGDRRIGLALTDKGLRAIDGGGEDEAANADALESDVVPSVSKIGLVLELLQCSSGASLADLTEATRWLPHTIRAALSGLRKKGWTVEGEKIDGIRRYRITGVA